MPNVLPYQYNSQSALKRGMLSPPEQLLNYLAPTQDTEYGDILPLARGRNGRTRMAMPNFLRGSLTEAVRAFELPGQVARGEVTPTPQNATDMALGLAGVGMGMMRSPGSLGVFGGINSKTADMAAL